MHCQVLPGHPSVLGSGAPVLYQAILGEHVMLGVRLGSAAYKVIAVNLALFFWLLLYFLGFL